MLLSTKMFAKVLGITALIATYGIGAVPTMAADTPVSVTNTTANPVPTVITNSSANLINTKVWNTVAVVVGNSATAPVKTQITNTVDNPVNVRSTTTLPVTDVNKPAHIPFSQRLDITFSSGFGNGTFTVPAGKRLVIKYVSADVGVAVGAHALFDIATYNQNAEVESHLPFVDQGVILGQQVSSMSQQTLIFADPGSTVTIAGLDSDSTHSGGMIVGVYGYLIDAAAASYE